MRHQLLSGRGDFKSEQKEPKIHFYNTAVPLFSRAILEICLISALTVTGIESDGLILGSLTHGTIQAIATLLTLVAHLKILPFPTFEHIQLHSASFFIKINHMLPKKENTTESIYRVAIKRPNQRRFERFFYHPVHQLNIQVLLTFGAVFLK